MTKADQLRQEYADVPIYLHHGACRHGGKPYEMTGAFLRQISQTSALDLALRMLKRHSRAKKTHEYDAVTKCLLGSTTQRQLANEKGVHQSTISDALHSGLGFVLDLL